MSPRYLLVTAAEVPAGDLWLAPSEAAFQQSLHIPHHRAGRALCMLAPPGTVLGCDLELIEPRSEAFVQDYFTAAESALVTAAPEAVRPLLAKLLWSAKESALKALRTGLRLDTRSVEIALDEKALDRPGWKPFRARLAATDEVFAGWWSRRDDLILTLCASPQGLAPEPTANG